MAQVRPQEACGYRRTIERRTMSRQLQPTARPSAKPCAGRASVFLAAGALRSADNPAFGTVSIEKPPARSAKSRRREIERLMTSSPTIRPPQHASIRSDRVTTSPFSRARATRTFSVCWLNPFASICVMCIPRDRIDRRSANAEWTFRFKVYSIGSPGCWPIHERPRLPHISKNQE